MKPRPRCLAKEPGEVESDPRQAAEGPCPTIRNEYADSCLPVRLRRVNCTLLISCDCINAGAVVAALASAQIVIRHTGGSKANRVENLSLAGLEEIRLGRDPSNTIVFDGSGEDSVSRKHAVIRPNGDTLLTFAIEDLGSANGTFVNKKKISGRTELCHGDLVTLGPNGPSFLFQLDPPPSPQMARTRVVEAASLAATRMLNATEASPAASEASPTTIFEGAPTKTSYAAATITAPTKLGVGRETMMLEISQAKRSANRQWLALLSLVLVCALAGGGYLAWRLRQEATLRQSAVADLSRQAVAANLSAEAKVNEAVAAARMQAGKSAQDIVRQYGPATAQVEIQWRLYDQLTGRPIFLKLGQIGDVKYPLIVKNSDGTYSPWLTLDDQKGFNRPIQEHILGSAFVVSDKGFLLTNNHIATGWRVPYFDLTDEEDSEVILISPSGNWRQGYKYERVSLRESRFFNVAKWIPESGGIIYGANTIERVGARSVPWPTSPESHAFVGRNDSMTVRFASTQVSLNAQLARSSDENDAALIKIDTPTPLQAVKFSDRKPTAGERVVVLGFPSVAEHRMALSETIVNGTLKPKNETIPIPYVTEGIVALTADKIVTDNGKTLYSEYGDQIQLTINSTGAGNSGGPVFDADGKVIGIFGYTVTSGRAQSTAAVPIEYGLELMKSQN